MIELINNFVVEADDKNVILKKRKFIEDKKTGLMKEKFDLVGYYGDLTNALNACIRRTEKEIIQSDCTSLKDLILQLNEVKKTLKIMFNKIKIELEK